ncbi:MAG TPA: glycosyltransferase family 4 protein [Nocardioidaceae bacterium]|nr:glycosyltransferase family 4 protein [Nocardioidaceae bacterium]
MKVLHVITRFIAGSGGNTLVSAAGMDRAHYETWVAAMPGGPLWEQAERAGVRTAMVHHMRERIAPLHDLLACLELIRLIRRERFTVVHTHCSKAGLIGRVAAWLTRTPVVVHTFHIFAVHPGLPWWRRVAYQGLERLVRRCAHHYVAVAPRVALDAVRMRLVRPGTISVVPSAVEVESIPTQEDPRLRQELGIRAGAPIVGTVGRIVAQKAPLDFVRMCALVHAQRPDVAFVMVGDADLESAGLEAETRREAERLGVPVIFTGFRDDAPAVAAMFDVYVVPSLWEGLGRAVTEAMASGRPIVATAVNGVPDLVEHGATGLLAAPGQPPALAAAVDWMLAHPAEAAQMGMQARQRVLGSFAPSVMCNALDGLYRDLLGLPSTGPAMVAQRQRPEVSIRRSA